MATELSRSCKSLLFGRNERTASRRTRSNRNFQKSDDRSTFVCIAENEGGAARARITVYAQGKATLRFRRIIDENWENRLSRKPPRFDFSSHRHLFSQLEYHLDVCRYGRHSASANLLATSERTSADANVVHRSHSRWNSDDVLGDESG